MAYPLDTEESASTANVLTGDFDAPIAGDIEVYDNTLREGEQAPGAVFSAKQKVELAERLFALGAHWLNVGFPAASADEAAAVSAVAKLGRRGRTAALSRMIERDIDITVDTGVDMVSLFLAGSDVHLEHKLAMTESEAIDKIAWAIDRVRQRGGKAAFTVEDASRTPLDRLRRMFAAADEAGADYLIVADTVGVLMPESTASVVGTLVAERSRPIGLHLHNDLGLALANSIAGLRSGATMVHTTLTGVGERAGNTCLAELAVLLKVKLDRDIGLDLSQLWPAAEHVYRLLGTEPPAHKPIVGRHCFTHESGIHVAGMLAHPEAYQPFSPALVGRRHEIVFGKHTGAAAVGYLARRNGIEASPDTQRRVVTQIKKAAEERGAPVSVSEILAWLGAAT